MNRSRRLVSVLLLPLVAACSSELEFADWRFDLPVGIEVRDYAPVMPEDRNPGEVNLVRDLVLGDDLNNPDSVIYQPSGIVASPDGRIFVGDSSDRRIHMFAPDGVHLKTFGKEGQGPGEFGSWSSGFTIAGDNLVIYDTRNRRFSIWTLDGEHVTEHVPTERISSTGWAGLADATTVSISRDRGDDNERSYSIVRRALDGKELGRLLTIELPPLEPIMTRDSRSFVRSFVAFFNDPSPMMTVGAGETVFVVSRHEYQVLAFSGSGEALWGARVAWPRLPFPENMKQQIVDMIAERNEEELTTGQFDWPPEDRALFLVTTDGAGRLFVFPQTEQIGDEPPEQRPVDVFSPSGEFLAAGMIGDIWTYAYGDHVYGIGTDPETEERVAVRYRVEFKGR